MISERSQITDGEKSQSNSSLREQKRTRTEGCSAEKKMRLDAAAYEDVSGYIMDLDEACHHGLVFDSTEKFIGSGNSGEVRKALWKDEAVAVMSWNGKSYDGFECFLNEITMLRTMEEYCDSLLGSVVPTLFISSKGITDRHLGNLRSFLVTKFVGNEIYRDAIFSLCLVDAEIEKLEYISDVDEKIIYKKALEGLKELQKYWILHRSVNLRNLRVKREDRESNKTNRSTWRMWWIDIGRAEFATVRTRYLMSEEAGRCSSLFATRKGGPLSAKDRGSESTSSIFSGFRSSSSERNNS